MKLKLPILIFLISLMLFSGCSTKPTLDEYVSELRSNCYESVQSDLPITAGYGYTEKMPSLDGEITQRTYALIFRLKGNQNENITYNICLNFKDKEYKSTFKLNAVSHTLTAIIPVDNFNLNEFDITLSYSSTNQVIKMKSTLPKGTISYSKALEYLQKHQSELVNSYYKNGEFYGEICARVLVKDNHPYWYIGLTNSKGTKALLIDGKSGDVLAVRDIFWALKKTNDFFR